MDQESQSRKKIALSYLGETNHLSIHWVQYYYSCMKELLVTSSYGLELILHIRLSKWTFAFNVLCISLVWESSFLPPFYGEKARQNCICNITLPWDSSLYCSPNPQIIFALHMLVHILAFLARKFRYRVGAAWHLSFAFMGSESRNGASPVISGNTDILPSIWERWEKKVKTIK